MVLLSTSEEELDRTIFHEVVYTVSFSHLADISSTSIGELETLLPYFNKLVNYIKINVISQLKYL